jgi:hypothetical protein
MYHSKTAELRQRNRQFTKTTVNSPRSWWNHRVLNYEPGSDFVFNNLFPGNTVSEQTSPMLMIALPIGDHYFYGGMKSLYLIGTVVKNVERAL